MHSRIKCRPLEAWETGSNTVVVENDINGEHADKFKKIYRDKFTENQVIRIAKRDNLEIDAKTDRGRFKDLDKVMYKCENDLYVVRTKDGRLLKTRQLSDFLEVYDREL
ncbi:hypothetical protein NGRA_2637 [Nosema granulosis]|uniref:Uncharacterized protein n=1 Tax=Nosema granulosis TaxID=83296 RepID=A0A9P6KY92_9MICR|nr:hypothetical protein NGRA_2637 [Nosema granulosis]